MLFIKIIDLPILLVLVEIVFNFNDFRNSGILKSSSSRWNPSFIFSERTRDDIAGFLKAFSIIDKSDIITTRFKLNGINLSVRNIFGIELKWL